MTEIKRIKFRFIIEKRSIFIYASFFVESINMDLANYGRILVLISAFILVVTLFDWPKEFLIYFVLNKEKDA